MFKSQIIKQMIVKLQGFQIMFCLFYTILAFDTFKNKVDQWPVFKNQEFRYQSGILTEEKKEERERVKGAVSQLWIRGLWWNGNQTSFNHTPGETSGNALFLEAVTRPSPTFPITSACGARNWPETNPKGPSSTRIARWPVSSGGPWPSHDASGADLGLARQDLRMPRLSPQKAGWQVPGTGARALGGRVQQL